MHSIVHGQVIKSRNGPCLAALEVNVEVKDNNLQHTNKDTLGGCTITGNNSACNNSQTIREWIHGCYLYKVRPVAFEEDARCNTGRTNQITKLSPVNVTLTSAWCGVEVSDLSTVRG